MSKFRIPSGRFGALLVFAAVLWLTGVVSYGRIAFEGEVSSAILGKSRKIHVYLPPSYDADPKRKFPVLYVQDGQNAFSTAGPGAAFGWGNWELDKTVDRLIAEKRIEEIIVVAVDCSNERYKEYRGPRGWTKGGMSEMFEKYETFLLTELKPKIDKDYRTKKGAKDTGTIGSSMGGVVSLALGWDNPEVFGKVASLSGAFQVEGRSCITSLAGSKGKKKPVRIYLDSGKMDTSGGDDGMKDTEAVAKQLTRLGWKKELLHYVEEPLHEDALRALHLSEAKFKEALKSQHNELFWRLRAWRALEFLFPPAK